MEILRVFLLGALILIGFLLWNDWENEHPPMPVKVANSFPGEGTSNTLPPLSISSTSSSSSPGSSVMPELEGDQGRIVTGTRFIHVRTDVLDIIIDKVGGNIVKSQLLAYPLSTLDAASPPFTLLSNEPQNFYVAQSGLMSKQGPDNSAGQATYQAEKTDYQLAPGENTLTVNLDWQKNGLRVKKVFVFNRENYVINVNYEVNNQRAFPWQGQFYTQIQRKQVAQEKHLFGVSAYTGGAYSTADHPYEKISFDKIGNAALNITTQGGWVAMLQHYFLTAWIPAKDQTSTFYSQGTNNIYTLGMMGTPLTLVPGGHLNLNSQLYVGPEEMDRLKTVAPHLDLTVDYGILWFISIALFWLLKQVHYLVGNWGWSIVIVTALIKLAFYYLSAKSYSSMARMKNLQPRLQMIKERYGDDKQKIMQETMALYKTEKVNPLGGCLPVIVQIPVFIALYWVLLGSVELRQAPFILWIHDLSTKDPYYILPILMGISMFFQQRLNPPPPDPMQAKVMMFLPIFFTAIFLSFPAGLVLYWVVNNTLSIAQQWFITERIKRNPVKKKR